MFSFLPVISWIGNHGLCCRRVRELQLLECFPQRLILEHLLLHHQLAEFFGASSYSFSFSNDLPRHGGRLRGREENPRHPCAAPASSAAAISPRHPAPASLRLRRERLRPRPWCSRNLVVRHREVLSACSSLSPGGCLLASWSAERNDHLSGGSSLPGL